ncbi:Formin-like protein 20-like [Heracleum sosnowskyi]|uniref:Formin-like protein 20-like n=1 Tax=Heracleum sosnowskyi TaxID=360622 RepID=A0AAD8H3L5_9APIA|nr:Formin-like protein 20-like [Heracleum sosnowskyi]
MEGTSKIIRSSVYTFLSNYHYFTISALFALPFSATILITQALVPYTSLLPPIQNRLQALLYAAGLPPSSEFFNILNVKLSETITSSILLLPFAFSFLLIAKASIIKALSQQKTSLPLKTTPFIPILRSIFSTQIWNSFLILSVNATSISIISIAFNFLDVLDVLSTPTSILLFSAAAALLYSLFLANAFIIGNLALVSSGMETKGGYMSIIKACVLIKGRNSKAISLALPLNMALAATEALFQYRVVVAFSSTGFPTFSMTLEWLVIAYLYSIFIVLDTIISCMFFKSCKTAIYVEDQESRISHYIDISQEDEEHIISLAKLKTLEVIP